jgi:hypothetical protein
VAGSYELSNNSSCSIKSAVPEERVIESKYFPCTGELIVSLHAEFALRSYTVALLRTGDGNLHLISSHDYT